MSKSTNDLTDALSSVGDAAPSLLPPASFIERRVRRRRTVRGVAGGAASFLLVAGIFAVANGGGDGDGGNEVAGEVTTAEEEIIPSETASTAVGANIDNTDVDDASADPDNSLGERVAESGAASEEPEIGEAITADRTKSSDEPDNDPSAITTPLTDPAAGDAELPSDSIDTDLTTTFTTAAPETTTTAAAVPSTTTSAAPATTTTVARSSEVALGATPAPEVPVPNVSRTNDAAPVTTVAPAAEGTAAPLLPRIPTQTIPRDVDNRLPFDAPAPGSDGGDEAPTDQIPATPARPPTPTTAEPAPVRTPVTGPSTTEPPTDDDGSDEETASLRGQVTRRSGNCMPVIDGPRNSCLEAPAAGVEVLIFASTARTAARTARGVPAGANPVASITTDANGRFQAVLPIGTYSIFVPDPQGEALACNLSDNGAACPVDVTASGSVYNPVIDAAVY